MRGFLDTEINGVKMWIREDYEYYNKDKSEAERLGDMLGYPGCRDLREMMTKAWCYDERLLYHMDTTSLDRRLYASVPELWTRFDDGYVHNITGEFVRGCKPNRDSYPAWAKVGRLEEDPFAVHDYVDSLHASDAMTIIMGIASIIEMMKRRSQNEKGK